VFAQKARPCLPNFIWWRIVKTCGLEELPDTETIEVPVEEVEIVGELDWITVG